MHSRTECTDSVEEVLKDGESLKCDSFAMQEAHQSYFQEKIPTITLEGIKMIDSKTNIQVSRETRNRLASLGRKDDTYDDIIRKLLDAYSDSE